MDRLSPDIAAEILKLMSDPAAASDAMLRLGVDVARFGQHRTNAQLLRLHEEALAESRRMNHAAAGVFVLNATNPLADVKPTGAFASARSLSELTPIYAAALVVGATHRGRVLRATIVGAPYVMVGAMMLLEDDHGDYFKLSVYNRVRSQAEADALFVVGRRLLVLEPYFKVMADGTEGVRCDDPREVVLVALGADAGLAAPAGAQDPLARAELRKTEGNRHFAAVEFEEAAASYTLGLDELDGARASGGVLALCCLNSAACHLKLGEPLRALEAANAALALLAAAGGERRAPPRPALVGKALARAAHAAAALSASGGARWAMLEAARVTGATDGGAELLAQIGERPAAARAPKATAAAADAEGLELLLRALVRGGGGGGGSGGGGGAGSRVPPGAAAGLPGAAAARPPTAGAAERARAAKARGNALFAARDYAAALEAYESAARECGSASLAAALLANRAAAYLRLGARPALLGALRDARAALAVDRDEPQPKARHRVVLALVALEWLPEAEAACDEALRTLTEEQAGVVFAELRASIVARRAAQPRPSAPARESVHERLRRARALEGDQDEVVNPARMESARVMMRLAARAGGGDAKLQDMLLYDGPFYDDRVAPFHTDFFRAGLMPKQCNVSRCMFALHSGYEHAASIRMREMFIVKGGAMTTSGAGPDAPAFAGCFVTKGDLAKRLRSHDEADLRWLLFAASGDVRAARVWPYEDELHHSFSNAAVEPTVMAAGRTHVAVGFADLGSLSASIAISGYGEAEASSAASSPTRWVGYEQSAYAVAKTAAIVAMMQRGASDDDVLQVWYSAAWSAGARASFRAALHDLLSPACARVTGGLDGGGSSSAIPAAVLAFLRHWTLADVSLAAAREGWLDRHREPMSFIGNFTRALDRHALCAYMLTGQLLDDAQVGSVVMFGVPDALGAVAPGESCLQTVSFLELASAHSRATCDVVETCARLLRGRIAALSRHVRRGAVVVRLRLATLTAEARALHSEIRALRPHTLNWSNVPDYFAPKAFHAMARACSADEDTVHVMHSMNWPLYTHGSSHMDVAVRLKAEFVPREFRHAVARAHGAIDALYRATGWDAVALAPPNTDIRNVLDFCFLRATFQQWADAFFALGGFAHAHQTMCDGGPIFSVLSRSDSTFLLAFSYDPTVKVRAAHHATD